MDSLHNFKETFEDPYIVARIQKFFGVSYKDTHTFKSTSLDAQNPEETTTFQRKKSVASSDNHEINENLNKLHETIPFQNDAHITHVNDEYADTKNVKNYTVKNKFWYFLFLFGTYLGDEVGYALSIPFLFWNIDCVVGRKLVLVWTIVMYVGQSIKDIVKWPRPTCPPVIRLQKKWSLEHGMPSTHAMVGIAFPSSVLYYSLKRYDFPIIYGVFISALWCIVISFSRLYLGMHSLLDVLAGLLLSSLMVIPLLPGIDYVDNEWLKSDMYWYPLALIVISLLLLCFYPSEHKWTPTKSDTATILGTCVGVQIGCWLNFHLKYMQFSGRSPPYAIITPDKMELVVAAGRTVLGTLCIVASLVKFEVLFKMTDKIFEKLGITTKVTNEKRHTPILDLSYKYLCYSITSFHVTWTIPILFHYLHIGSRSYYTE